MKDSPQKCKPTLETSTCFITANSHFNFRRIVRCCVLFLLHKIKRNQYHLNPPKKRQGTETTKRNCDTTQQLAEINPVSVGGGVGVGEGAEVLFLSCCSTENLLRQTMT